MRLNHRFRPQRALLTAAFATAIAALTFASPADAETTITVSNQNELADAIDTANASDEPVTIELRRTIWLTRPLPVIDNPGTPITIASNRAPAQRSIVRIPFFSEFRVLDVRSGDSIGAMNDITLDSVRLRFGDVRNDPNPFGGCFSAGEYVKAELTNVVAEDCAAVQGGGLYLERLSDVLITDSIVRDNTATSSDDSGAGIFRRHRPSTYVGAEAALSMTVTNTTIEGNVATGRGGGVHSRGNDTFIDSRIVDNTARVGAGVHARYDSPTTLINTVVENNTPADSQLAQQNGGLIVIQ